MDNSNSSRTPLVISIIALIISVVMIVLFFTTKNSGNTAIDSLTDSGSYINDTTRRVNRSVNSNIAYVNTDSLLLEYRYSIKLNEDLLTEQAKARASFESKYRQFERKYNDFAEKARLGSFISQASMESQQNELMQEQSNLERMEAELSQKLMEKQASLNRELLDSITNFLNEYNYDNRYSLILSNALGSNVLYGDPGMDITREVIDRLNSRYVTTTPAN